MDDTKKENPAHGLTLLQQNFVLNIMAGMSQRQAYLKAGGKAKNENSQDTISHRMFNLAKVRAYYDHLKAKSEQDAVMTKTRALEWLSNIVLSPEEKKRDQLEAMKQLSKMNGWDAPIKNENINFEAEKIPKTLDDFYN